MSHLRRVAFFGFAAAFCQTWPAAAQEDETFSERVDVRVINLEAVVEDERGNRVEGLGAGDFEILVDGKARPADYFTEIRDGLLPAEAPGAASPPALAGLAPPAEGGAAAPSRRLPTSYLVFFDLMLSNPRDVLYAGERLAADFERLPPEDQIAVFTFEGTTLLRLADWNSSRADQLYALRELHRAQSKAAAALNELKANDELARLVDSNDVAASVVFSARRFAQRMDAVLTAGASAMRAANPPPGRRVMLAFAGMWPRDLAAFFGVATSTEYSRNIRNEFPKASYHAFYETANQLGYTLYPTDVSRLRAPGSAEIGEVQTARDYALLGADRDFETDVTLGKFAEETGGRSFASGWKENALEEVRDDVSSFYWLGFDAPRRHDGKSYQLEVKVKKPGLKVRSRRQYSDLSRQAEVDQELASRLLFDTAGDRQDFKVTTGEPQQKGRGYTLPVSVRIPLEEVFFRQQGSGWRADLELRIAAIDELGRRSPMPSIPVKLDGPKPQPGQFATYETALRLRHVSRRFVLGLYDTKTSRLLVSTVRLAGS